MLQLFNVLHAKKQKIYTVCIWKHNSNREKHVITLIISNEEGCKRRRWYYLAVKRLSALTSKRYGLNIFIVYIVFIPLDQKINLNRIKEYVKIKPFVTL